MTTQQNKNPPKASNSTPNRSFIWLFIIVLSFLLLAWVTWCFFNWKIKVVEKYPIANIKHVNQYPANSYAH